MELIDEALDNLEREYIQRLKLDPNLLYEKLGDFKAIRVYIKAKL